VALNPEQQAALVTLGMAIAGFIDLFFTDQPKDIAHKSCHETTDPDRPVSLADPPDSTGAALTPQTVTEGADDPDGFKSKVLAFAATSEPLFITPTFSNPAAPVSLYLTRDESGTFKKVLDESVFSPAEPGRPTPWGHQQQWLLNNINF